MTRPSDGRRGKGGGWVREMGEGEVEGGRGILPVVIRHHPLYPAVTRCHPLSPVAARRHPLLPVVTRSDPSSTDVIRRQTRHPAPMACFFAALPPVDLCGTFPRGAAESLPRGLASSGLTAFPHHCWDRTDIYLNMSSYYK